MGRLVDIAWHGLGISIVAELADDTNPDLCEELWSNLPFTILQDHAIVAGESIFASTPFVSIAPAPHKERIDQAPPGRLRFSQAMGSRLVIQYGKALEELTSPVLGQVLSDFLPQLPKVGKAVWESTFWTKELIWTEVKRHGAVDASRTAVVDVHHPVAKEFTNEAMRIMATEPEDLKQIRLGLVRSAGSYGQYFGTWNVADGMLRDYVTFAVYPLLRLCEKLRVDQIAAMFDALIPPYADFLEYFGFKTLGRFSKSLRTAIHDSEEVDDAKTLLRAIFVYLNRLYAWAYHYFPWYLGIFFGRPDYTGGLPGRFASVRELE